MDNLKERIVGRMVTQFGQIGTIVDCTFAECKDLRSVKIHILWSNAKLNKPKEYSFPMVFLQCKMKFIDSDPSLPELLEEARCFFTCHQCHKFLIAIHRIQNYSVCPLCKKHKFQLCEDCKDYELIDNLKFCVDGKYRCQKCLDARYPLIVKDFSVPSEAPTMYVRKAFPYNCTHHHKMFCVTAKVIVRKNDQYHYAHINLHFCETCNKYYIPLTIWNDYIKQFGYICLPRNVSSTHSSSNVKTFQESTLLSRWGYSTSLTEAERRDILMSIVDAGSDSNYKSQVVSILSSFVYNRYWQPDAVDIWREDLRFIEQHNASNQQMIDLSLLKDL